MAVTIRHDLDTSRWSPRLEAAARAAGDLGPALRQIGELEVGLVRRNFEREGGPERWPALSQATLLARARGRSGRGQVFRKRRAADGSRVVTKRAQELMVGAKPLIFSARLMRSITYAVGARFVDIGTNVVYAARQFFGWDRTSPKTPARNPFGHTAQDHENIRVIFARHLFGPIGGG